MVHIEKLSERILFLKGDVEMKPAESVEKIHDVKKMLKKARKMEEDSAQEYNVWANECARNNDAISKQLFESLVGEEETHFDQFDVEVENMEKYGDNYLALQSIERSKTVSSRGQAE
jgi:bacterioferritin